MHDPALVDAAKPVVGTLLPNKEFSDGEAQPQYSFIHSVAAAVNGASGLFGIFAVADQDERTQTTTAVAANQSVVKTAALRLPPKHRRGVRSSPCSSAASSFHTPAPAEAPHGRSSSPAAKLLKAMRSQKKMDANSTQTRAEHRPLQATHLGGESKKELMIHPGGGLALVGSDFLSAPCELECESSQSEPGCQSSFGVCGGAEARNDDRIELEGVENLPSSSLMYHEAVEKLDASISEVCSRLEQWLEQRRSTRIADESVL